MSSACTLGLVAGVAFAWLWLRIVPWGVHRAFWSAMPGLARDILQVDDARIFLGLYRRLGALVGGYVARNLGGTVLACLPLFAILAAAAPLVFEGREVGFFAAFALSMLAAFLWPAAKRS